MSSEMGDRDAEDSEEYGECVPPNDKMELLFLIEFLVDTMLLKPENMGIEGMDPCLLQGQACIELIFLQYPTMCICEADVDSDRLTGGNYIKFNAGKSLMFALPEDQLQNPPPIYLTVVATKMLPHGCCPNKIFIGETKICLTELFKQVSEKVDSNPDKLPLSKSIKDKYVLMGSKSRCPTAEVTIYIRLSCLGQNVVTEFQRAKDDCEPFLFKSKQSKKVYECTPKDGKDNDADMCPPLPGWGQPGGKDCGDCGPRGGKCASGAKKPACGGNSPCGQPSASRCNSQCGGAPQQGDPLADDDEYEEFGTEVHGHALTIKVQRSQKRQPNNLNGGKSVPGNQIMFQVPQSQNLCNKGKSNRAMVYNVNAVGGETEPLQIVQGVDSPDKDIFVLRVGKKGEAYAKGKLELELRTPKPKIEWPDQWPKKSDKSVQTEKEEAPKKGKGKGKKKK